jgi:hypothetical protein
MCATLHKLLVRCKNKIFVSTLKVLATSCYVLESSPTWDILDSVVCPKLTIHTRYKYIYVLSTCIYQVVTSTCTYFRRVRFYAIHAVYQVQPDNAVHVCRNFHLTGQSLQATRSSISTIFIYITFTNETSVPVCRIYSEKSLPSHHFSCIVNQRLS